VSSDKVEVPVVASPSHPHLLLLLLLPHLLLWRNAWDAYLGAFNFFFPSPKEFLSVSGDRNISVFGSFLFIIMGYLFEGNR